MKNCFCTYLGKKHLYKNGAVVMCRIVSLVLVLSVLAGTGVFLRPAAAGSGKEMICGLTEHQHTDECYDSVAVCGVTDDINDDGDDVDNDVDNAHEHTESCFYQLLVCGVDAHTHTDECFASEDAGTGSYTTTDTDAGDDTYDTDHADVNEPNKSTDESGSIETVPPVGDDADIVGDGKTEDDGIAAIAVVDGFETDIIYYRVKRDGEYVLGDTDTYIKNDGNAVDVYIGDVIEFVALIENPNSNWWDGRPDTGSSGMFTFESGILSGIDLGSIGSDKWEKADEINNVWRHERTAAATSIGSATVYLSKNGKMDQSTLTVNVIRPSFIHVHNIRLGNMEYDDINIHTVTRMMDWNRNENNQNSRYIVYVGQTLALSASQEGNFVTDSAYFKELDDTSDITDSNNQPVAHAAKYLAMKPGDCEITFTDQNGKAQETFYIEIRYPIYVKTSLGEYHKNRVHEHLADIPENKEYCITDPNGMQIYIKNSNHAPYILLPDSTVELVVYVPIDEYETANFMDPRGVEFKIINKEKDIDGDFAKITAVVEANDNTKSIINNVDCEISFSGASGKTETFYIQYKNGNDWWNNRQESQHFDIEIGDGGTYTSIFAESKFDKDGREIARYVTEIVYTTTVSHINSCKIFRDSTDTDASKIMELEPWEYSEQGELGKDSQYELTSAWATKKRRDNSGIERSDWIGDRIDGMAKRSVATADIDHVIFDVDLVLFPKQRTLTIYTIDPNDANKWIKDAPVDLGIDGVEDGEIKGYIHRMEERDIIDALNKCPNHSGLDFTLMTSENSSAVKIQVRKIFTGGNLNGGEFTFELYRDDRDNIPDNEMPVLNRDITSGDNSIIFIADAKNDENGRVIFPEQDCPINPDDPASRQSYTFYVREVIPPDADNGIIYDERIVKLTVSIQTIEVNGEETRSFVTTAYYYREDDESSETGRWEPFTEGTETTPQLPTFYNILRIELPSTGGAGIYAYTAAGSAIILISFVPLYVRRRRKSCVS